MMDFMFFIKTFVLTLVLVLFMQIEVGKRSIEMHAMNWVQSSSIAQPINAAAKGGAKLIRVFTQKIYAGVRHNGAKAQKKDKSQDWKSSFRWLSNSPSESSEVDSEDN